MGDDPSSMTPDPETWISAISAVVFLAVGVLAVVRARTAPLAPPLSRMTASLFAA